MKTAFLGEEAPGHFEKRADSKSSRPQHSKSLHSTVCSFDQFDLTAVSFVAFLEKEIFLSSFHKVSLCGFFFEQRRSRFLLDSPIELLCDSQAVVKVARLR